MANKIADAGWNLDTLVAYLAKSGAQVEQDNDGQIVIYTGLYENAKGELVEPDESEFDDNGNLRQRVLDHAMSVIPSDSDDADPSPA